MIKNFWAENRDELLENQVVYLEFFSDGSYAVIDNATGEVLAISDDLKGGE